MQTWTNPIAAKSSPFSLRAKIQEDFCWCGMKHCSCIFTKNIEIWASRGLGRLHQPPMDLAHWKHHWQRDLKMTATFPCSRLNPSPFPFSSLPRVLGLGTYLGPSQEFPKRSLSLLKCTAQSQTQKHCCWTMLNTLTSWTGLEDFLNSWTCVLQSDSLLF